MDGHHVAVRALGEAEPVRVPEGAAEELVPGGGEGVARLYGAPPVDPVVAKTQHVGPVVGEPRRDLRNRSGKEQVVPAEEEQIGPTRRRRTGVTGRAGCPGAVEYTHTGVVPGELPGDGELRPAVGRADDEQLQITRPALRRRLPGH